MKHFETLYQQLEVSEMDKLNVLTSHVYIPINDDVITEGELNLAASSMRCIPTVLMLLTNMLFSVHIL